MEIWSRWTIESHAVQVLKDRPVMQIRSGRNEIHFLTRLRYTISSASHCHILLTAAKDAARETWVRGETLEQEVGEGILDEAVVIRVSRFLNLFMMQRSMQ